MTKACAERERTTKHETPESGAKNVAAGEKRCRKEASLQERSNAAEEPAETICAMRFGVPRAGSDTGDPPHLTDAGTHGDVPPQRPSPDVGDDPNAGKRPRQQAEVNFSHKPVNSPSCHGTPLYFSIRTLSIQHGRFHAERLQDCNRGDRPTAVRLHDNPPSTRQAFAESATHRS
jgi:hypothetical protein